MDAHRKLRVTAGPVDLDDHDPAARLGFTKPTAVRRLRDAIARIAARQDEMMATSTWSMLAVFQGMDGSGKDGTIAHVFAGVNPAGVTVTSFKAPTPTEQAHDFLWRIHQAVPASGHIGVFNRSHYEDVLAPKVHHHDRPLLHLPPGLAGQDLWRHRYEDIVHFEQMLTRQGVVIVKFFLHISKSEQRQRLLDRLEEPAKNWKFEPGDLAERSYWDGYRTAYEEAIAATATPQAPWFIIPADHKWLARMLVAEIVAERLDTLDLPTPAIGPDLETSLAAAKDQLDQE